MDPLSVAAAAVGLTQVCFQVIRSLKELRESVKNIQEEIDLMIAEVETTQGLVLSIQQIIRKDLPNSQSSLKTGDPGNLEDISNGCERSLKTCKTIALQIQDILIEISGKTGSTVASKLDGFSKEYRRRNKSEKLKQLRERLAVEKSNLQVLLIGMSIYHQDSSRENLAQISKEVQCLDQNFKLQRSNLEDCLRTSGKLDSDESDTAPSKITGVRQIQESIVFVQAAIRTVSLNEFFDTPQPVSSFYTGRNDFLERLSDILLANDVTGSSSGQLRFVIYGMGGSGKAQFCCKFAEINRERFWGVFYVDASSHEIIKQTYAEIGKRVNAEPNYISAMNWLSNREGKWLLVLDNANDRRIDLNQYFPRGDRGCIIITTRNADHIQHGNVGSRFFEFQGMSDSEASILLLRAAQVKQPWDMDTSSSAIRITKKLGSLALALVQAGAAIRCHLCKLKDYLGFYDRDWDRIRHTRSPQPGLGGPKENEYLSAHTIFEVSYRHIEEMGTEASRDAIQLLKMFSFFHARNIRFDILKRAIENCQLEKTNQAEYGDIKGQGAGSWYQTLRSLRLLVIQFLMQERGLSALPEIIREGRASGVFDNYRLRRGLRELHQLSLITYHESIDSYSIHPVIHKWARERPDTTASEQAVWAHAAALTLGHSILLPPLGDTEEDEIFRRDIQPHIDHVRLCQKSIDGEILKLRKKRLGGLIQWPGAGSRFGRPQALLYMKFSFVFGQNGGWKEAETLQLEVKQFADTVLGLDHPVTRRITLALSGTYWNQGRVDEAAELQNTILGACMTYLGPRSHETLLAMDTLGQSRWQQGRYSEAKALQRHAVDGLMELRNSKKHEDTLSAMGNLGRTLAKFYENLEDAKILLEEASNGMSDLLGPTHLKTLAIKEDLAMLAIQMNEKLPEVLEILQHILGCRKDKLGKEHPFTLLSMVSLARCYIAMSQYDEAERLVRRGLDIADRNLGEDHIGTLMGRTVLGTILTHQLRYHEAEATLRSVIEKQRCLSEYRGDFHPDRLGAMIELSWCLRTQGKLEESIEVCDIVIEGLGQISLKEHPLEKRMRLQKEQMAEMLGVTGSSSGKLKPEVVACNYE